MVGYSLLFIVIGTDYTYRLGSRQLHLYILGNTYLDSEWNGVNSNSLWMSVMATGVRFPLKLGYLKYIHCRSFYTSAIKMEEAIEKLQKNPYYEKYANRIAQLQRTSPEEFMTRMESAHCSTETEDRTKLASLPDTRY